MSLQLNCLYNLIIFPHLAFQNLNFLHFQHYGILVTEAWATQSEYDVSLLQRSDKGCDVTPLTRPRKGMLGVVLPDQRASPLAII